MKRKHSIVAAGLVAFLGISAASLNVTASAGHQVKPPDGGEVCNGDFGTNVKFVKTPSDAARQALKEEKLVFVLHVSGDFEDPDFT